ERSRHARGGEVQAAEQLVDQLRALDQVSHEEEKRNGDQHVVRHHAVGALHEKVEHLPVGERRIHAAVGEPGEEHAHAHEGEGSGEAHHDPHHDQRQHHQAEVPVGEVSPGHQQQRGGHDKRDQGEAEPQLLAQLHLRSCFTTYWSSFWMSSSFTCSSCFSLSTSTSTTSSSREAQSPVFRQLMQRMISTMPCISTNAPASGITVLKG